ncbi:tetratricopeptide repeat protein [Pseudomonas paralcaligenes]|uniref:tetratricopeptide repeat protein n=1 Tax=Pseudomonas paralcaligenes TaxID=2772558 RepID=UPI001C7FAD37|nr:tetratricopeptide repeat protein [Pseudomonas paralcaligenes]
MNDIEFALSVSPDLAGHYEQAKDLAFITPGYALTHLRSFAAVFCDEKEPSARFESNIASKIEKVHSAEGSSRKILSALDTLRDSGNKAAHPEEYAPGTLDFPSMAAKGLCLARELLEHLNWLKTGRSSTPEYEVIEPTLHIQRDLSYRAIFEEDAESRYTLGVYFKEKADRENSGDCYIRNDDGYGAMSDMPSRKAIDQAMHWFKSAAESNHSSARYEYGAYLYRLKDNSDETSNHRDDRLRGEHQVWLACLDGHSDAQALMGDFFFTGTERLERDYERARELYQEAAEQSHPRALAQLGRMHEQGLGGPKNIQKAFECSLKAAESGFPHAQYHLYALHLKGRAFVGDRSTALNWLTQAAEQRHPEAMMALAGLIEKYKFTDRSFTDAQQLYKQCFNSPNHRVQALYGYANLVATHAEDYQELHSALNFIFQCREEIRANPQYSRLEPGINRINHVLQDKLAAAMSREFPHFRFSLGGAPAQEPPAYTGHKIGRNDPCPCGKGAKYKNCCMRQSLA